MIVIDTDILIDHFHDSAAATAFVRDTLLSGETLVISIATVAEILAGMRDGEEDATNALLSLFQVYPADEGLARFAGAYLNQYAAREHIDLGDALIAATALVTRSELYTRNVRHYPMSDIIVKVPYQRGG
jgi:predicted nucleic acid-binding protein